MHKCGGSFLSDTPGNGQRQALPGAACSIAVDREGLFPTGWEVIWKNWN